MIHRQQGHLQKKREKSEYSASQIVAELPYLAICAGLFQGCWYAIVRFGLSAGAAALVFLTMFFYEMLYTGIAQFIAANAPNPPFAALAIPVVIAVLTTFSGLLIPYQQLTVFWRYWMYYLDPFRYLLGSLMSFTMWNVTVECNEREYGRFDPPTGQTCGAYMADFLQRSPEYLRDPDATSNCEFCGYKDGREYLNDLNLGQKRLYAWRDLLITLLFCVSSYALVFTLLKLRNKRSKTAK